MLPHIINHAHTLLQTQATLQEPQRLYYLLKLRHIYESGQLPFTPRAAGDGGHAGSSHWMCGCMCSNARCSTTCLCLRLTATKIHHIHTDDEAALTCSVFAYRRATTPRNTRLRLPRLAIAPPNTLFDDDEQEDEDSGGRGRHRSSSSCPYTLDRPRACLDFAVLRLPSSSFLRLVEMLDPGEWWPHALPPVPTPTPAAGLSAATTTVREEALELPEEEEDSKNGKGRAKLTSLEEMRRKKEVERWMEAEAKHAKRPAGEADTGKEGKDKTTTGGSAVMGTRTRWGPGTSSSSSSSAAAAAAAEAEAAAEASVTMSVKWTAWKKEEEKMPIVVEKE